MSTLAVASRPAGRAAIFAAAARLCRRSPGAGRAVAHHVFGQQADVLRDGGTDLPITYLRFSDEGLRGLEQRLLREEPRAVFRSTDHALASRSALTVDDVAEETFLLAKPRSSATWSSSWTLRDQRRGRGMGLAVGSKEDVVSAITQRLLVVIAPAAAAEFYRGRGVVASLCSTSPPRRPRSCGGPTPSAKRPALRRRRPTRHGGAGGSTLREPASC